METVFRGSGALSYQVQPTHIAEHEWDHVQRARGSATLPLNIQLRRVTAFGGLLWTLVLSRFVLERERDLFHKRTWDGSHLNSRQLCRPHYGLAPFRTRTSLSRLTPPLMENHDLPLVLSSNIRGARSPGTRSVCRINTPQVSTRTP